MQPPRLAGIVRVTNSREEIEQATRVALDRKREGYSPEALVLAIDEILEDVQLSRAIIIYVQSVTGDPSDPPLEHRFPWFLALLSAGFSAICLGLDYLL